MRMAPVMRRVVQRFRRSESRNENESDAEGRGCEDGQQTLGRRGDGSLLDQSRHRYLLATPPAAFGLHDDGRSPGSRVDAFRRLPGLFCPVALGAKARRLQLRGQPRFLTAFPFHPVSGAPSVTSLPVQGRSFKPDHVGRSLEIGLAAVHGAAHSCEGRSG